jgi:conjugative relaxase-like TrwC/TraI family protein
MLSVSAIGSAGGAAEYYGKDDYYVTGEADAPGVEWKGKGAAQAGLSGTATSAQFRQVLSGTHPTLQDPDRAAKPDDKHRPGWDMTFSAPKSVSLAYLVGGDERLVAAHRAAVDRAMAYAEKYFAVTRVRDKGSLREVRTGNLIYASTEHTTSRKGDPQLHTHNVVANATWDEKAGKFRALESLHLFKNMKLLGAVYRAELAKSVMALGYDVKRDTSKGTFELAAFKRSQLQAFSKRNADIREALKIEKEKHGELSGAQRDALVLRDRPKKLDIPRAQLQDRWKSDAKAVGLDSAGIVQTAKGRDAPAADVTPVVTGKASDAKSKFLAAFRAITGRATKLHDTPYRSGADREAVAAVDFAVRVAEQGKAVFTRHDIVGRALEFGRAGLTVDRIEAQIDGLSAGGKVLAADRTIRDGLTTDGALALERRLVREIEDGRGAAAPMMAAHEASAHLQRLAARGDGAIVLNEGQTAAATLLLTSGDRFVGVQGLAGVGKTTMFRVVNEIAQSRGIELAGIAPTHQAAEAMTREAGIKAETVEAFLSRVEREEERGGEGLKALQEKWAGRTLLADEASMLSNAQMDRLARARATLGLERVVLIGDERQLGSPEAGAPWRLALSSDIQHASMTEIRRQKDPEIRTAVERLAKSEISGAFRSLGDRVVQVGRNAADMHLADAAVAAWNGYRAQTGALPPIIVPTNSLRAEVADKVRTQLIAAGQLGEGKTVPTLAPVRMSRAETSLASSYREGQVLVFHRGVKDLGISKNDTVTVVGRDERNNLLVVERDKGGRVSLDLSADPNKRRFEAYTSRELEVREGETLVWDRTDKDRDLKVGGRFTVDKIENGEWHVRKADGTTMVMKESDPQLRYISHGYAETADRSQGSTYKDVVAVLSSKHGEAATEARAYVQVSRTAEQVTFVTNDLGTLVMKLNKQSGHNAIASHELAEALTQAGAEKELASLAKDGLDGSDKSEPPADKAKTPELPGVDQEKTETPEKADEKAFEKQHEPTGPTHSPSL